MALTVTMTKGLPASGKSSWALAKLAENPGAYKRVNKDDLRAMLDGGKWSHDNEKFLLAVRDRLIEESLRFKKHVIVDDTNLAHKHEPRLREIARFHGAEFRIEDFTAISVEECIRRDLKRLNSVGEAVIRKMHRDFLEPKPTPVARNPELPDCVIVDIDGTLAQMDGRGPYEWHRVGEDTLNVAVRQAVEGFVPERTIICVSGRDGCCREGTERWLTEAAGMPSVQLHMRYAGDSRDDRIVKREIYERHIQGQYNVIAVFDDRPKVVRMWRSLGLFVFDCGDGVEF